ncbi:histidine phosphatase family protein [Gilvimarinus xylanilyticus]|uniref:Histidine phosphatase family protein n=1 Tax=Gilvimarinus xylanilyticus TaxID=2944139 RepID=A0A9X2KTZ5_9GAMM|nr:histidine phosphatase family protein [Gilvimarinus xylanilyticus]MCP8899308.1 histidine phosphatase family protein [Gilvimarinus xylanilyticus]
MRAFALIRHGDYRQKANTPSAHQPYPLTPAGENQAEACAEQLNALAAELELNISSCIHTSPLLRAWQTGDIIRRRWGDPNIQLQQTQALSERCVGSVANLTIAEIEQLLRADPRYPRPPLNWKARSDYCLPFPGAESLNQAGKRVADYINQLCETAPAHSLTPLVGHGAAFRHGACALGILSPEDVARLSMFHAQAVIIAQTDAGWIHLAGQWKPRPSPREFTD